MLCEYFDIVFVIPAFFKMFLQKDFIRQTLSYYDLKGLFILQNSTRFSIVFKLNYNLTFVNVELQVKFQIVNYK